MKSIDLNSDVGESYGDYVVGNDEALMPFITSANIACGFHAGDPRVIDKTVRMAIKNGVAVGAHPGYPDIQWFGRRQMVLTDDELETMVLYQVSAVAGFARSYGEDLVHVKPHGAMYNHAAINLSAALAIARGTARFSKEVILVGLAGSRLIEAGLDCGLRVANEGFPDRRYNEDGTLMPRKMPGSVLIDKGSVSEQAVKLVKEGVRFLADGKAIPVQIDTLCIHGDNPEAVNLARAIREKMAEEQVEISRLDR